MKKEKKMENNYQQDPNYNEIDEESNSLDGYAIASLILGIVSFFVLPIIGSILAIVFGNVSIRRNGKTTMARAGKILGIISLILMIVVFLLVYCLGILSYMDMFRNVVL